MNDHKESKSVRQALNRRGAPSILLAILAVMTIPLDIVAYSKIELRDHLLMDPLTERRMALIAYVHPHCWIGVAYLGSVLATILWLEIRRSPRWSVWLTFLFLSTPCLGYAWACMGIFNKLYIP